MTHGADEFRAIAERAACAACGAMLPPPGAPQACPRCLTIRVCLPVAHWPDALKRYAAARLVWRRMTGTGTSPEEVWRRLLVDAVQGAGAHLQRGGVPRLLNPDDAFPIAMKYAEAWAARGFPIDRPPRA